MQPALILPIVNHPAVTRHRHTARRQAALRRLGQIGPFLEGFSLRLPAARLFHSRLASDLQTEGQNPHRLCAPGPGPRGQKWHRAYKQFIREVSRHSLAIIHGHVANPRAASRSRAWTRRLGQDGIGGEPDFRRVENVMRGERLTQVILLGQIGQARTKQPARSC